MKKRSAGKGIYNRDARFLEVGRVAGRDGQIVLDGTRGDQAIFNGHWRRMLFQACEQFCPAMGCLCVEIQNDQSADAICKPLLQQAPLAALGEQENSVFDFAQYDGSDGKIGLMVAQPFDDAWVWNWAGEFA